MRRKPSGPPGPLLAYTIDEAAEVTRIGRSTLYAEIKAGRLLRRKRGRSSLIMVEDLTAYLAALPRE